MTLGGHKEVPVKKSWKKIYIFRSLLKNGERLLRCFLFYFYKYLPPTSDGWEIWDAEKHKSSFLPLWLQFPGGFRSEQSSHQAPGPGSLNEVLHGTLQSWGSVFIGFSFYFSSMELLEKKTIKGIIKLRPVCYVGKKGQIKFALTSKVIATKWHSSLVQKIGFIGSTSFLNLPLIETLNFLLVILLVKLSLKKGNLFPFVPFSICTLHKELIRVFLPLISCFALERL